MPEYVVDCEHVPYGDGMALVLPVSVNGHVHEPIVRCRDCEHAKVLDVKGEPVTICYCRKALAHTTTPDGFCDRGRARSGDGEPS